MAELRCAGTGSSGNAYALMAGKEILLLDAGRPVREIERMADFRMNDISGGIISHGHADHAKYAPDLNRMGIGIWCPYETDETGITFGKFQIKAFELPHNGVENRGFVIRFDGHVMLYLTDFECCKYSFRKLRPEYILVECNYQKDLVEGSDIANLAHKVLGHAELQTTASFVSANKTDALKNVILCHMGRGSDPETMVKTIKKAAGKGVKVDIAGAQKGIRLR